MAASKPADAKAITVKDKGFEMRIAYRFDGEKELTLTELTVAKAGEKAMFASLDFEKQ